MCVAHTHKPNCWKKCAQSSKFNLLTKKEDGSRSHFVPQVWCLSEWVEINVGKVALYKKGTKFGLHDQECQDQQGFDFHLTTMEAYMM